MYQHEYFFNNKALTKQLILNKDIATSNYIKMFLSRTQQMFEYKNLPDTIPQRMLELYLQTNGTCVITKVNGDLYAFMGGLGGEPDPYYQPTIVTVANPALKISKEVKLNEDGILMFSDSLWLGLLPLIEKYALLLTENDITMRTASINMRLLSIISVKDDKTKESALEYLRQIEKGQLGILLDGRDFLTDESNLMVSPTVTTAVSNYMTQLAEYNQYLKASLYNELGLQANYNMKRETLNSAETEMDSDVLIPLVDDMLNCRKLCVEKVNEMFGTNIEVDFSSAWEDRQKMRDLQEMASYTAIIDNEADTQDNIVEPSVDVPDDGGENNAESVGDDGDEPDEQLSGVDRQADIKEVEDEKIDEVEKEEDKEDGEKETD